MGRVRIVLDTNVLVSGIISRLGPPGFVLDAWLEHELYELVTSDAQLQELGRVMTYGRLKDRICPEHAARLLERLKVAIMAVDLPQVDLSPDPDDNAIIATAIAGHANLIVSGDKRHLVSLGDTAGIPIITARQYVETLGGKGL